jgi:hypothetical protein
MESNRKRGQGSSWTVAPEDEEETTSHARRKKKVK